jgi:hypothetical protein
MRLAEKRSSEAGADGPPVQAAELAHRPRRLIFVFDDETRHAVLNDFRHRSGSVGNNGRSASHRLDHDETEGLRPIDRE